MYNMQEYLRYLKQPVVLALVGTLIYYILERLDCYINARKTASLNRRSLIVFVILFGYLYYITMEQNGGNQEIFTDIGNF